MNENAYFEKDIKILEELEANPNLSQSRLSKRIGMSVGLVNLFIKRLSKKGYLKLKRINGKKLAYLVTPTGLKQKAQLTKEYLESSVIHYIKARKILKEKFNLFKEKNIDSIYIYATREWAEIAYLTAKDIGIDIKGFIVDNDKKSFLDCANLKIDQVQKDKVVVGLGKVKRISHPNFYYILETDFEGIN